LGRLPLREGMVVSLREGMGLDIPHPQVQETFPENFVEIALLLPFISFYSNFKIFAEKFF